MSELTDDLLRQVTDLHTAALDARSAEALQPALVDLVGRLGQWLADTAALPAAWFPSAEAAPGTAALTSEVALAARWAADALRETADLQQQGRPDTPWNSRGARSSLDKAIYRLDHAGDCLDAPPQPRPDSSHQEYLQLLRQAGAAPTAPARRPRR